MSVISMGITYLNDVWVEFALSIVNVIMFVVAIVAYFSNEGKKAATHLLANDLERENMVKTGKYVKLDTAREYSTWKGFFIGLVVSAPLIIMMIIHLIYGLSTNSQVSKVAGVASLMYLGFYSLYGVFVPSGTIISFGQHFILLYSVPFIVLSVGLSYYFGARKIFNRKQKILNQQRNIYGDKI